MGQKSAFTKWKNTSKYPDAWARPVCEWIAERFSIPTQTKEVVIRNTSRGGHGHACGRRVVISCQRRDTPIKGSFRTDADGIKKPAMNRWRRNWKYAGMSHDNNYTVATPLESFVMIAAHEIYHVSPAGRNLIATMPRQRMEFFTNRAAYDTVIAFRGEVAKAMIAKYRKAIRKAKNIVGRERMKISIRNSPQHRLDKAEAAAQRWTAKAEKATRLARKWTATANRIRGAMLRRGHRLDAAAEQRAANRA